MDNTLRSIVFVVLASMVTSLSIRSSGNAPETQVGPGLDTMPDSMNLTMEMKDRIMTMNLTINPNIPPDFPVFAAGKNMTTAWTPSDGGNMFSAYEDRTMGASVIVRMINENGQMTKYMSGIFPMDGRMYSFSPVDNALHDTNATDHVMEMDGTMYSMKDEGEAKENFLCDKPKGQSNGPNRNKRDAYSNNGKAAYQVDMLMVIDYSIYRQWYSASTASDRNADAQNNIVYYFANVAAGMDMRYSTILNSDFTMRIRLVGIYIAVDQSQSTFTDGYGIRYDWNYKTYTHAYKGLDAFETWAKNFYSQRGNVFDQATLFTGNFMYNGQLTNGNPSRIISGLGNIGNASDVDHVVGLFNFQNSTIGFSSATINHDSGIYASIETASHELGHNLGSQHDGDGNNCLQADQYIMASAPGTLTDATFNHPFTFSPCSIQYMSTLLRAFTRSNPGNNLLQQSPLPSVTPSVSTYPGQMYTVDQQCKQINGDSSYYCAGGSRDHTICMTLACWDATSGDCKTSVSVRAYDGTTCGNRMWCMMGQCVSSSAAPSTNTDTCIYGDYKGPMRYADNTQPGGVLKIFCTDVATTQQSRCYETNVATECCKTCGAIQASSPAGCPYGDKDPGYCRTNGNKYCYDNNFKTTCCSTCASQTSTVSSIVFSPSSASSSIVCPLGDQNPNYCSTIQPNECYSQTTADYCCSTCARYNTKTPGCEYGNRAGWCGSYANQCQTDPNVLSNCCQTCASSPPPPSSQTPTQNQNLVDMAPWCTSYIARFPGYCYDMQTQITCGSSCGRSKKSNSSCQWGDKADWCSSQYCNTDRNVCCATCP